MKLIPTFRSMITPSTFRIKLNPGVERISQELRASIPLVLHFGNYPFLQEWLSNPLYIIIAIVITSLLLVSEIPMFALKVKSLKWKDNKIRYAFLISLLVLAVILKWLAIPLILFVYLIFSVIENVTKK